MLDWHSVSKSFGRAFHTSYHSTHLIPKVIMDQFASYCLIFFLLLLPLLVNIKTRFSNSNFKLPPGPRPLPIIGNIHHLIGSVPHRALHKLSLKYGEILFLQLGELQAVIISSSNAAREIMKTHDLNFATRGPKSTAGKILTYQCKDVAFAPYGEYWRQIRKICILELLSMKRVQSFRSIREEEVGNLIRLISSLSSDGKLVNLSKKIFATINDMSVRAVVGSKCKDQDAFLHELAIGFDLTSGLNLVDMFPSSRIIRLFSSVAREANRCHQEMDRILDGMIQEHRERKKEEVEDLLGVLLGLYDEGLASDKLFLSLDTIKAVIFDAFEAGSETSTTALDWAMFELMRNPRVMHKAQSEIRQLLQNRSDINESDLEKFDFLHLIIKETLRLHPPLPLLLPRECRETCRILGHDIPKGATVMVNAWTIGRDSKYWEDAEEFKPERFQNDTSVDFKGMDFEFIPFGAGRRICPGISFGLANMQLALASLLYHFDWELPDGARSKELDMTESDGLSARRKSNLWLRAIPYVSS
ncbi:hypothetical protein LUZ60_004501 [Juncus effusus]|nr:hypothetical protein LUZ60_004501 [Juncus effusus]